MKISFLDEKPAEIRELNKLLLENSVEITGEDALDALVDKIADAKYVLLGESSHGTHEYYTMRSHISQKLIQEKEFSFIAVEGDWPDCYRLNRYVKNYPEAGDNAVEVLHAFNRWPTWMWANWEIVALAEWLKEHNSQLPVNRKVGFYGLDVYSLWESLQTIIKYLDKKDPKTKHTADIALKCFEPYSDKEGQAYAKASVMVPSICESEVIDLLLQVRKNIPTYNTDPEEVMSAEQNAHVIVNAEQYYRVMMRPGPDSWNLRDHHMMNTLNRLVKFHGHNSKAIIWAHNTHIGDARATDMLHEEMVNLGQLVNEQHQKEGVFAVGFGSYSGTVIAGDEWGSVMREMDVPDAKQGSWEEVLHHLDPGANGETPGKDRIVFMNNKMQKGIGKIDFGHRAIGVVYHPQYELLGNYVPSHMPYRYDAFVYLDETSALHPLHLRPDGHQIPETYPFGI